MGCKIGNSGGGMVELFTAEDVKNQSGPLSKELTTAEIDKLANNGCDLILVEEILRRQGTISGSSYNMYSAASHVISAKSLKDYITTLETKGEYFIGNSSYGASATILGVYITYNKNSGKYTLYANANTDAYATYQQYIVKFIGIKL